MKAIKQSQKALNEAADVLKKGGVVICPTDTVYGFLADASNKKAVEKIYKIKKRAKSKPLPVFIKDIKTAEELAEINTEQKKILKKYWPGKVTVVIKRKKNIKIYDGGQGTVALRIPKHKFLLALLKKINRPLAQTSVNISGQPALINVQKIIKQFQGLNEILFVDAGNLPKRKPSAIIDLSNNKVKFLRK